MEIKGDLTVKKDLTIESLPNQSVLGTDGTGKIIAGSGGSSSTEIVALIPTQINVSSAGDTYTDVAGNTYAETANQTRMTLTAARIRTALRCLSGHVSAGTGSFQLYNFTDSASLQVYTTTSVTEAYINFQSSTLLTNKGDDITLRVQNSTAGATVTIDNGGIADCDSLQYFDIVDTIKNFSPIDGYAVNISVGLLRNLSTSTCTMQLGYTCRLGSTSSVIPALFAFGSTFGTAEVNTVFTRTGTLKALGYYSLGCMASALSGMFLVFCSFQTKLDNI